mgnify:CR=1 FL=1
MNKSQLRALIRETVSEMFDPMAGAKHHPDEKTVKDKQALVGLNHTLSALKAEHTTLRKHMERVYGDKYNNIEVYLSVGSDGQPEIQVHGSPKDPSMALGGNLNIRFPQ